MPEVSMEKTDQKLTMRTVVKALQEFEDWEEFLEDDESDIDQIIASLRGVVKFSHRIYDRDTGVTKGHSKIGGTPDLPDTVQWPQYDKTSLSFLAQINLADISTDTEAVLPRNGILYFFIPTARNIDWDHSWKLMRQSKVLYHEGSIDSCSIVSTPLSLEQDGIFEEQLIYFSNNTDFDFPMEVNELHQDIWEVLSLVFLDILGEQGNTSDTVDTDQEGTAKSFTQGHILGTPDNLQEYIENEWPQNYRLLFQCNGAYIGWGADMMLYFGISETDLKSGNFNAAKLVIQGS